MKKPREIKSVLSKQDREIWERISNTATPLPSAKKNLFARILDSSKTLMPEDKNIPKSLDLPTAKSPVILSALRTNTIAKTNEFDANTAKKIQKGKIRIDGRLDLHGLNQMDAWQVLRDRIENAYYSGEKILLVITGKGNLGTGVLRQNVPQWLAGPPFSTMVSQIGPSHPRHGGEGALYVRIRKRYRN